jgi:hypothetical protein
MIRASVDQIYATDDYSGQLDDLDIDANSKGNALAQAAAKKKQRGMQRQLYFQNMAPGRRDIIERAAHILDLALSDLWKLQRVRRRMRSVIRKEAPWRARMCAMNGKSILGMLEREVSGILRLSVDSTWFSTWNSGVSFDARELVADRLANEENKHDPMTLAQHIKLIPEMIQSFVRSVTLSSRSNQWNQVIETARQMLDCVRLINAFSMGRNEGWRSHLWRGQYLVGDLIMDLLESIDVEKVSGREVSVRSGDCVLETFDKMEIFPTKPQQSKTRHVNSRSPVPVSDLTDLEGIFIGHFPNKTDTIRIDLAWCKQFLVESLEEMHVQKKHYKTAEFGARLTSIFNCAGVRAILQRSLAQTGQRGYITATIGDAGMKERSEMVRYMWSKYQSASECNEEFQRAAAAYDTLIESTIDTKLVISASIEFADLLASSGNSSSCIFYSKAIDMIFGISDAVTKFTTIDISRAGGIKDTMMAAIASAKMAKFSFGDNLDRRFDLIRFSTSLFYSILDSSSPHPSTLDPTSYLDYNPRSILPGFSLFLDKFTANPIVAVEKLLFLSNEWILTNKPEKCLPLLSLAHYIAENLLLNRSNTLIKIACLRSRVSAAIGDIKSSIDLLNDVCSGSCLSKEEQVKFSVKWTEKSTFVNTETLSDPRNAKTVKAVMDLSISEKLQHAFGKEAIACFELTRCRIIIHILSFRRSDEVPLLEEETENGHNARDIWIAKLGASLECVVENCKAEITRLHALELNFTDGLPEYYKNYLAGQYSSNWTFLIDSTILLADVAKLEHKSIQALKRYYFLQLKLDCYQ